MINKPRNTTDQEIVDLIKSNKETALISLFERNFLDAKLISEKLQLRDKYFTNQLSDAVTIIWEFFSMNHWIEKNHKIDFMVLYTFQRIIEEKKSITLKKKSTFTELEPFIEKYFDELNNQEQHQQLKEFLRYLSDTNRNILLDHLFEGKSFDDLAEEHNLTEEQIQARFNKAISQTSLKVKMNIGFKNLGI